MAAPAATILIPTRGRPRYLDVALASIVPQARAVGAEIVVVTDGPDAASAAVTSAHRVRLLALPAARGANAARNAGVAVAAGELVVFVDDDVEAPAGWLGALLSGACANPEVGVFGGPIRARLEGGGPRACGRESAPITTLDLGADERDVEFVWSANMLVRASALQQVGRFDESLHGRGDEEDWLRRYGAAGGRVRYLPAAGLEHRRDRRDARLRPLSRSAYGLGRAARRWDVRKGSPPSLARELRVLAGCAWHTARRRCAIGVVLAAHAAGRVRETVRP